MHSKMHWDYIAILALLVVIVPWRSVSRVKSLLRSTLEGSERIALYLSTIVFQWVISVVIAWRCYAHGLTSRDLGVEIVHPEREIASAIIISALLVTNQFLGVRRLSRQSPNERGLVGQLAAKLLPRKRAEKVIGVLLIATVAVCEEFIYRGFVQAMFQILADSALVGTLISAAFFALAHLYQGRRGVFITFVVGLVLSGVRIWTGSLLPCIAIHFSIDLAAGIASYRMLGAAEA